MRILIGLLILCATSPLSAQDEKPFQVLVAENANIYGTPVEPLQYVDDVTSIEIADGGFVSLVHEGGTTYEHTETVFTFYLKPEKFKDRNERPMLDVLYEDSTVLDPTKIITVLHPPFDRSGYLVWNESEPFEVYWHLYDEPVVNYILSVSDNNGNKIQDFRTQPSKYLLKPETYGLSDGIFNFKISSTFAGTTIESKTYTVKLESGKPLENKTTDLILKALDLELSPELALPIWQEALAMPNGQFYKSLFMKFLIRNDDALTANGQDVQQLLSQAK